MGGAQPLAATMNGAAVLVVEVDRRRIERRLATTYLDESTPILTRRCPGLTYGGAIVSRDRLGSKGTPPMCCRNSSARNHADVVTDQTSAHDALNGYVPHGMSLADAAALRARQPDEYIARSMQSMARHVEAMLALKRRGAVAFDYGNNIRHRRNTRCKNAFDIPASCRICALCSVRARSFRWAALSEIPKTFM